MSKTAETEDRTALRDLLHKLNNDLSLILGYMDLALRSSKDASPQIIGRLSSAKEAAKRMAASISDAQRASRDAKAPQSEPTA